LKRISFIVSVLCLAFGASLSFAQDRMGDGMNNAMEHDAMSKPATKPRTDRMEKSNKADKMDRMGKMEKTEKSDKMDKTDKMEKPGSAY